MAVIEGFERVLSLLSRKAKEQKQQPSVKVGYSAPYSLYVHENLEMYHRVGQAKFLTEPMHRLQPVLARMVREGVKAGKSLSQAMLEAGEFLQVESQRLCPVDTGFLRDSAYIKLERVSQD